MPCPRRPGGQPLLTPWVRFFSSKMDVFITYYPTCESGAFPFGSDPWKTLPPWPILQLHPPAIREENMGAAGEEQLQEEEAPPPLDTRYGCPLCHVQAQAISPGAPQGRMRDRVGDRVSPRTTVVLLHPVARRDGDMRRGRQPPSTRSWPKPPRPTAEQKLNGLNLGSPHFAEAGLGAPCMRSGGEGKLTERIYARSGLMMGEATVADIRPQQKPGGPLEGDVTAQLGKWHLSRLHLPGARQRLRMRPSPGQPPAQAHRCPIAPPGWGSSHWPAQGTAPPQVPSFPRALAEGLEKSGRVEEGSPFTALGWKGAGGAEASHSHTFPKDVHICRLCQPHDSPEGHATQVLCGPL